MSAPAALASGRTLVDLATQLPTPSTADEPAWLAATRREATRWIARHGFPDKKHEDWRYVDLKPLLALSFAPVASLVAQLTSAELASIAGPGLGGPRLVVVNGRFDPELSKRAGLPDGVRVTSLAPAGSEPGRPAYVHAFDALNAALAADTFVLEIAQDALVQVPIEIVYLTVATGDAPLASPRAVIVAGARSSATVVETYLGGGQGPSLTNATTRVIIGPSASLEHYKLQNEHDDAFHLSTLEVEPGRAAGFASHLLAVGASLGRHEVRARLEAEGARVDFDGLYLASGDQCHDNPVLIEHRAPGCASRLFYKGIVDGAGHGIFNGQVIVRPGADRTDARQTNKNLLLSDRAEVDTRPRLEIFADDVSATHGAAVGQLDPDALFYLRSRGIPERAAHALLIAGFANEILEQYASGPLRERAERIVASRLDQEVLP